jgi:signal transduction histidine kinase
MEVRLQMDPRATDGLELSVETALYRIVQESLTNVAKHAQATSVEVSLDRTVARLRLTIADNGRGWWADSGQQAETGDGGFGLDSISQRAQMMRGECTFGHSQLGGALVEVVIPT